MTVFYDNLFFVYCIIGMFLTLGSSSALWDLNLTFGRLIVRFLFKIDSSEWVAKIYPTKEWNKKDGCSFGWLSLYHRPLITVLY
jgi:hypothetical protein